MENQIHYPNKRNFILDIKIKLGLQKCYSMFFIKGKLNKFEHIKNVNIELHNINEVVMNT